MRTLSLLSLVPLLVLCLACETAPADPPSAPATPPIANSTADTAALAPIFAEMTERQVGNTVYLRGTLNYALQEDGTGEKLWKILTFSEEVVLYDPTLNVAYLRVDGARPPLYEITFPQQLNEVAYGWEDEAQFPYRQVVEVEGHRYVGLTELAEKNGAYVVMENAYGDVTFVPRATLRFMAENYYPQAAFSGEAWREIYRRRARKSD